MIGKSHISTPLGEMIAIADHERICLLVFAGQKHLPHGLISSVPQAGLPLLSELERQLRLYFAGGQHRFTLPVDPAGTPFQKRVWALLMEIPPGETVSYGFLARRLSEISGGPPTSARAVGGAVGRNPVSLIIPCHRVIGADGSLTGYAGGMGRKAQLLELEQRGSVPMTAGRAI